MNRSAFQVIWKLLVLSLLVGLALDYFGISPVDLIHDVPQAVGRIYNAGLSVVEWGGKYVLLGAIIVLPVWLLMNLTSIRDRFRNRK